MAGVLLLAGCATAAPEPTPFRPAVQLFVPATPTVPSPTATPLLVRSPTPADAIAQPADAASVALSAVAVEVPVAEPSAPPSPVAMIAVVAEPTPLPAPTQPEARPKAGLEWVNVRRRPGLNAEIVAKMLAGGFVRVVGRNAAGDWFAVQYDESDTNTLGYVSLEVADVVGDVAQLPVMEPVAEPTLTPIPIEIPAPGAQLAKVDSGGAGDASVASVAAAPPAAVYSSLAGCPTSSGNSYELVPREGGPADRPDRQHGDLNLALRSYGRAAESAGLVDYNGPTDGQAPQLSGLFIPSRFGAPTNTYRVNIWRFESGSCGGEPHGCRGPVDDKWPVTLMGLAASAGEPIAMPSRDPIIYPNAQALVLFADETRITLGYTRQDTIAYGYAVYIENVCVDPILLALYRAQVGGDGYRVTNQLPGLRNGQVLGTAVGGEIIVGVRDTASWLDPRSRKDWWQR